MISTGVMTFWNRGKTDPASFLFRSDLYMWALSATLLKAQFSKTVLVTDRLGKRLFINELQLPFDEVKTDLEGFLNPRSRWVWAAGKLKAYSLMEEPFLHIDGDVFLLDKIPAKYLSHPLLVQGKDYITKEDNLSYDIPACKEIFKVMPDYLSNAVNAEHHAGYCLGVFGGYDLQTIKLYADDAIQLITDPTNEASLKSLKVKAGVMVSQFVEQYTIRALVDSIPFYKVQYIAGEFAKDYSESYVHLCGPKKKDPNRKEWVRDLLSHVDPDLYIRCQKVAERFKLRP